jgi:hypothetical protein
VIVAREILAIVPVEVVLLLLLLLLLLLSGS